MKAKKNKRERSPQMQAVSAGLQDVLGMTQWRTEHPHATLREIEEAVDQRMNQLRAQLIEDVARLGTTDMWSRRPNVRGVRPVARCWSHEENRHAGCKRVEGKRSS